MTTTTAPSQIAAMTDRLRNVIEEEIRTGYTARTAGDIPVSAGDVTAEWLTAVLCRNVAGAAVESVEILGGSDGSTSRRAIHVRYNEAGTRARLPERLFGKATPSLQNRLVCGFSGAIFAERDFYMILRPELDIEAPRSPFAAADAETFRSIILLEEMSESTVFPNPHHYIDRGKAEDMVGLLARVHAKMRGNSLLKQMRHMKTSLQFQIDCNDAIDFEGRSNIGIDRAAHVIPSAIVNDKHAMWHEGLMGSLTINSTLPATAMHSDVHIGNWYITGAGRMGLMDWQCLVLGHGAGDVAYALSSALTVADRRAWERDLLALYVEKLREFGATDEADLGSMWLRYRQQMFHALYNWVYTIGAGAMQPNMQPDDFSLINIERMAAAIDDLESLKAVREDR